MDTKQRFSLVVALFAGALALGEAPDALAGGKARGRKRNQETVRMVRPAGSDSARGSGSITTTRTRRGDDAVMKVRGLEPRTTYEVNDGSTGELLGTFRTNGRGRATFDLNPALKPGKRAAQAGGEDAGDVPDLVEVTDPETGDPVLEGDTTGELQALYGYASMGNATESAVVTMGSDPTIDTQFFSFSYYAAPSDDGWYAGVYEVYLDTSMGDDLPLGKASVLDLAGLRFQVRDADGNVAFRGTLPDVEAYSVEEPMPGGDEFGIWAGYDEDGNWTDEWNWDPGMKDPFDFDGWYDDGSAYDTYTLNAFFGTQSKSARCMPYPGDGSDGTDPRDEEPVESLVYELWIETPDGFEKAADLVEPWFGIDDPWGGGWDDGWYEDDWTYYDDGSWDFFWDWGGWDSGDADWDWMTDPFALPDDTAGAGRANSGGRQNAGRKNRNRGRNATRR